MEFGALHPLAIVVAGSVGFAVGGLWYAPFAFGPLWLRYTTVKPEDLQAAVALGPTLAAFVGVIVQAAVLAVVMGVAHSEGFASALGIATLLWLGFTAAPSLVDALEARRPLLSWFVDAGHRLAAAWAMALVLASWPA